MNSLFSIVHYEKLHTQILNVLRKIAKKNTAYISFSIYLSLKSPPLLSGYMACPCAFLLRYYLDRSLEEILSKFYSNPIHRPW